MTIVQCRWCHEKFEIPTTPEQMERWEKGELIQRVFPELTPDQRELLISQTCGDCWDATFAGDEEDEEEEN